METRWHVEKGHTLKTIDIQDRELELHITRNCWSGILEHIDRKRLMQEAIENEKAHKLAQKKECEEMIKNWKDSKTKVIDKNKIALEHQKRLEQQQTDRINKFLELRKEQEVIRQKFIADARKAIYVSQGHPRNLTGALILSEVIDERKKQKELNQQIMQQDMETEAKYAQQVKEAAVQEKLENLEKEKKLMKNKLELRKVYLQEINKKEQLSKTTKETRVAQEREDSEEADLEREKLKKQEYEMEQEMRAQARYEVEQFNIKQKNAKELAKMVEKEQDLVIDVYSKTKHKIQCLRIKKEREMRLAKQARGAAAIKVAVEQAKAQSEEEERILQKAHEDREKEEIEKLQAKAECRNMLIKDRQEDRKRFVQREEKRMLEEAEWKKQELLNRFKSNTVMKAYEENKRQEEWKKTLEYRKVLLEQIAEDEEKRQREKADNIGYDVKKFEEEDKKFLQYANECLEYTTKRGRPTLPVERVILEYKKENNLLVKSKECQDYGSKDTKDIKQRSTSSQSYKELKPSKPFYNVDCRCFR